MQKLPPSWALRGLNETHWPLHSMCFIFSGYSAAEKGYKTQVKSQEMDQDPTL